MNEADWLDKNVPEQARAFFTTLCFMCEIEADTAQADAILNELYLLAALDDIISYEEYDMFMCKLIV